MFSIYIFKLLQNNINEARGIVMDLLASANLTYDNFVDNITNHNTLSTPQQHSGVKKRFSLQQITNPENLAINLSTQISPQVISCLRAVAQLLSPSQVIFFIYC